MHLANRVPMDTGQFLYCFDGHFLLQKAFDPVCGSVCCPRAGILEGYFLCKCFLALVALVSVDEEIPQMCSAFPYGDVFEFDLSVLINIYTP